MLENKLPRIHGDPNQLRQVVMNLLINASEAICEQTGLITMRTGILRADDDFLSQCLLEVPIGYFVYLEVSDTGCGIDAETKEKMFEPFFTTKFTGRGLGLAAVLGIIRQHQGTLRLYSEQGRGTSFRVLFPVEQAAIEQLNEESSSRPSVVDTSEAKVILLVDDEASVRKTAKRMLHRHGYTVLEAENGKDALEVFRSALPKVDLVLLDLTMPVMGGEECFRELRKINENVSVVLISGYTELDVMSHFSGRNFSGFVQKPFTTKILFEAVSQGLESSSM